jgi:hypothetical protein
MGGGGVWETGTPHRLHLLKFYKEVKINVRTKAYEVNMVSL